MLTLKQIYDDKARIIAGLEKKHFAGAAEAIEEVLRLDGERKAAQQAKDAAAAEMNKISKSSAHSWRKANATKQKQLKHKQEHSKHKSLSMT